MADKPRFGIRRFDVFAEYNRIKNESEGMPADQARGRAIWLAKIVAGRRGMPGKCSNDSQGAKDGKRGKDGQAPTEKKEEKFLSAGGEEQTDQTFEREIVERMGSDFYHDTFQPAIERAFTDGKKYEEIRDSIRKTWK